MQHPKKPVQKKKHKLSSVPSSVSRLQAVGSLPLKIELQRTFICLQVAGAQQQGGEAPDRSAAADVLPARL